MDAAPKRMGLIAGWGRYPIVVAQALKRQGYEVHCTAIKDHVDPQLAPLCDSFLALGIGKFGAAMRHFRRHGVAQATMAGKVHKHRVLFRRLGWISHLPDLTTIRMFFPYLVAGTRDRRDDSLLLAVVDGFARAGIRLAPATNFAPELLVKEGTLTRRKLTLAEERDVAFGWRMAKEIGRLDIGQTVVVKGQSIIAVEAIEGTDECIRRAGTLCKTGGLVIVKVAKPQQDMRFDVPTIGVGTIQSLIAAKAKILAIEAGKTIIVDQPAVIALAEQHGIAIVSLHREAGAAAA